jgi:hypothetical protein
MNWHVFILQLHSGHQMSSHAWPFDNYDSATLHVGLGVSGTEAVMGVLAELSGLVQKWHSSKIISRMYVIGPNRCPYCTRKGD